MIEWLKRDAKTERNVKVICEPWVEDYFRIYAELRLNLVVVSGAAQVIKSLGAYLFTHYCNEIGGLNTLYTFAKSNIRDKLVATTVKPIWLYNREMNPSALPIKSQNNKLIDTDDYTSYFSFAYDPSTDESVAVPAELASISVDMITADEYQQSDPRLVAVLKNRMDNGRIESRPMRFLSTPGREGIGIIAAMNRCDQQFYPHVKCPHCGEWASLHPTKALLKTKMLPDSSGQLIETYFDEEMRIVDWHHKDPEDPINSAHFICHHCHRELDQKLFRECRYLEMKTLKTVDDFIKEVDSNPHLIRSIGLWVCPFLRRIKTSIAARFIHDGVTTDNPLNYIQQTLGMPTTSEFDGLTPTVLQRCIDARKTPSDPENYDHVKLLGMDMARGSNYVCVMDAYIPIEGTKAEKYHDTIRSIKYFTRCSTIGFSAFRHKHGIDFGALDLAPDMGTSSTLAAEHNLLPCLQKHAIREVFKENTETQTGGIKIKAFDLNNQYFLNQIIHNFTRRGRDRLPLTRLPRALQPELDSNDKTSALAHLMGLEFDLEREEWVKGDTVGHRCDYAFALLFAEVALYYYVHHHIDLNWLNFFRK